MLLYRICQGWCAVKLQRTSTLTLHKAAELYLDLINETGLMLCIFMKTAHQKSHSKTDQTAKAAAFITLCGGMQMNVQR